MASLPETSTSSGSLLSTNIDGLFETMNVDDIQQVLRRMRFEVERKREELRVTVGNRYRDLIEAADTISEMRKTSEDVKDHLLTVEHLLGSLKHRQLLGFQTDHRASEKNRELAEAKREYRALAAQMRLLMELPEIIWRLLDASDCCGAAQVQQLGLHLYLGLTVGDGAGIDVHKCFPVVRRQKVALRSFDDIIVRKSEAELRTVRLDHSRACDSGCSLVLQRGVDSVQLLDDFLRLRAEALRHIPSLQGSVKQQVNSYLQYVTSSLLSLHALFVEGFPESNLPQALLSEKLKFICQSDSTSTLQLLGPSSSAFIKQLPPILTEFKPVLKEGWRPLSISTIRTKCLEWFAVVRQLVPAELSRLLTCVTHIKTLAALRDAAYTTLQTLPYAGHWAELSQRLLGQPTCLWDELLQPAITAKIEALIQSQLDNALETLRQSVSQQSSTRTDLKSWLWSEVASDLPQSIAATPNSSGVFMKTRCYTPTIQHLCAQWDNRLKLLWEDMSSYQQEDSEAEVLGGQDAVRPFDRFAGRSHILVALERHTKDSVRQLVAFLNERLTAPDVVFYSKLVSAMVDLCPNFKRCIVDPSSPSGDAWQSLTQFIRTASLDMFQVWMRQVVDDFEQNLQGQLKMGTLAETLKVTPLWDEMLIQEEGESGDAVQSQIRVPMNASFSLQSCLFKLCQDVNQIGPHAVPKKAQGMVMDHSGRAVLSCYQKYVKENSENIPQAVALQLLFDVRFVSALLVARDSKPLQEKAKSLCESLEGRIDPFDLDVFNPHIQRHVKRTVQRLQLVFGPLLTCDRHAILWAARVASPAVGGTSETPSLVALVPSVPRLLPLPVASDANADRSDSIGLATSIAAAGSFSSHQEDLVVTASQKKSGKSKSDAMTASSATTAAASVARSGAAVFFGWGSSIFGGDK